MQSNERTPKQEPQFAVTYGDHTDVLGHLKGQLSALRLALVNTTENDPVEDINELAWIALQAMNLVRVLERHLEKKLA